MDKNPSKAVLLLYQAAGEFWDSAQTRRGYYKKNIPIPGIVL